MANFAYTIAKANLAKGTIDLCGAGADVRVMLVMSNTTADTDEDAATISAFGTRDEVGNCVSGYCTGGKALASEVVNTDCANDRSEFDATDLTWCCLAAGARNLVGAVVYKFCTSVCASIPLAYIDSGFNPCGCPVGFATNGGNLTLAWNAQGIIQLT